MKIALITEGVSEYKSFPKLYEQLATRTGNVLLAPVKVNVSPDARAEVIARQCQTRLKLAKGLGATLAVLVLDREDQSESAGEIAEAIEGAMAKCAPSGLTVRVVLKNRAYENWLVADIGALVKQPKRFKVSATMRRAVQPDKADRCDALALLKKATLGPVYEKVSDSVRICQKVDVGEVADHSRSFRHFLHVLGDPVFAAGCKKPTVVGSASTRQPS